MRRSPGDDDRIPVLWLCGPPGVGKTAVGWEIFTQLTRAGIPAGYVDLDQLGMCYPEPARDPGRHRMKAQNAGAVVTTFRAAGSRCVIVSGVADPARGVPADQFPQAALTVARLRADRDVLVQRFTGRGGQADLVPDVLGESGALDASDFADVCVDTSARPVAEAARVKARNLAALWRTYLAAGAECLTVVGPVEDETAVTTYTDALPSATVVLCRLHAGRDQLTRRILLRGRGGGSWPQPGDPLLGRPTADLLQIAGRAAAGADALERAAVGAVRVDTDGRTVGEVADVIAAQTGWPGSGPPGSTLLP